MTRKRPDSPTDIKLTPLGCRSASFCDCGQPAAWIAWLKVGKQYSPRVPFRLCDHCLQLELNKPVSQETSAWPKE